MFKLCVTTLLITLLSCVIPAIASANSDANTHQNAISNDELIKKIKDLEEQVQSIQKQRRQESVARQKRLLKEKQEKRLEISGFFTAAVATTDRSPNFTSYEDDVLIEDTPTFNSDTIAALQFNYQIDAKTSYTHQILSRASEELKFINTEWAFLRRWLTDSVAVRAGRLRSSTYMLSDTLEVGFTYPWVRPPSEIYRIPLTSYEGFDFRRNFSYKSWYGNIQFGYGRGQDDVGAGLDATMFVDRVFTPSITISNGELSFRAAYLFGKASVTVERGSPYEKILNDLIAIRAFDINSFTNVDFWYANVGARYDDGINLILAEYSDLDLSEFPSPIGAGGYFLYGRKINNWFPHFTVGHVDNHDKNEALINGIVGIVALVAPSQAAATEQALTTLVNNSFKSYTLGVNYFVSDHTKLKADVTHLEGFSNGNAVFDKVPTNSHNAIYSLAIDTVF